MKLQSRKDILEGPHSVEAVEAIWNHWSHDLVVTSWRNWLMMFDVPDAHALRLGQGFGPHIIASLFPWHKNRFSVYAWWLGLEVDSNPLIPIPSYIPTIPESEKLLSIQRPREVETLWISHAPPQGCQQSWWSHGTNLAMAAMAAMLDVWDW
jgi:hypothetical protein